MTRRLLILAAFLLAGAVVNVGVAWGCAVWIPASGPYIGESRNARLCELDADRSWRYWSITRFERSGAVFYHSNWDTRSEYVDCDKFRPTDLPLLFFPFARFLDFILLNSTLIQNPDKTCS